MSTQPVPATDSSAPPIKRADRTTTIGVVAIIAAMLILIALIVVITILPAQTIAQTVEQQASEQQRVLAGSLARQTETYFNSVAYDLIGLINRPEIKSSAPTLKNGALALIKNAGLLRSGQFNGIVRLDGNGTPLYAWPDDVNKKIDAGQPLSWTVDAQWIDAVVQRRTVQLVQLSADNDKEVYLLVAPVTEGLNVAGVLAIEVNLDYYFYDAIHVDPGKTGQLWVFSKSGKLLFQLRNSPSFTGDIKQVLINGDSAVFKAFPDAERESAVAGVSTVFGRTSQAGDNTMYIVLSRSTSEAQESVFSTLRSFGLFGVGTVIFIMVVGLLIGRFLLAETNRRRAEEQRRSTARTLLVTSRALNSSLDLNIVLQRILGELAKVLPHDSASILLLTEDKRTVKVAADTDKPDLENLDEAPEVELNKLRGAREVVLTGRPVVINDTATDPRWRSTNTSSSATRAWLGVPLRVRDDSVGVLNIDSHTPDRFLPDDIDLAEAFADQAGVAIQNARAHEVELKVYEQELETARAIQTSLLPQDVPPVSNIEMAARSIPARQVSGDYYQYYMMPDGKLGVAVGDVSGKGIPAALLMAVISTALRDEILRTPSPSKLLNELNTRLQERMRQNNMNSALLMLYYDPVSREMEVANGGMLQPYLRTDGNWENIEVGGYPLGAAARGNYSQKSVSLTPNSMVVMVSDGVVESQNLNREFFGFEGLETLLAGLSPDISADDVADCILAAVREHLQAQDPQDDITVVVMKSLP